MNAQQSGNLDSSKRDEDLLDSNASIPLYVVRLPAQYQVRAQCLHSR